MTGTTRRNAIRLLGGVLAVPAVGAAMTPRAFAQGKDFKIGVIASMTGPASPFFKEYVEGFQAYAKSWNTRGGVNGRPIALNIIDDESAPVPAANGYRRIAADPDTTLAWVAGPGAGGLAIKALGSELKLPVVSGGALDSLGIPADPYFFKIAPANRDYMKLYLTWCKERGYKKLAFVLGNDAYGQGEAQTAKEITASLGLDIVALETFSATDSNFSAQLVRVRSAAPDIVYAAGTGAPGILIYKQYRQLGLKYPLCFMLAALTSAFFQAIGGASEADGVMTPGLLGMLGDQAKGESGKLYAQLVEALGRPASLANTLGWDIGIVSEAAIKKSDATRNGIRAALDQIKDLPGINGPITYTPDNHIGQDTRGLAMLKLAGGKFVPVDQP
jgi:branched-chain amino acid transport system substrate-binding protein